MKVECKDIIFLGGGGTGEFRRMLIKYAERYGLTHGTIGSYQDFYRQAHAIKRARFIIIWNGMQGTAPLAAELCRTRGIPHCFVEYGVLPQDSTILVDTKGFCGRSMLNGDLSWVTDTDRKVLEIERQAWQRRYPRNPEGFILVPLQLENDTQVLFNSRFRDMSELIAYVEHTWGNAEIVVRPHPKAKTTLPTRRARFERGEPGDWMKWAARASMVVGINSTALYEAAMLGVPTVALGDCPLRTHQTRPEDRDTVLAGLLAMRLPRTSPDLAMILERHNIRPLGTKPLDWSTP